jgi:hypothetical protein
MPATVRLNDIVEALEMQIDECSAFLDRNTGEVETVSDDLLRRADDDAEQDNKEPEPDLSEWQQQEWEVARQIVVSGDRFLSLPSKFDVHEWEIMQDFCRSLASNRIREDLLHAIHGAGAFRMFKDTVRRHGIEPAWFAFRTDALKQIALDWCEENHIAWE